jgi:GNAT superfamily N-acetyltransferase
MEKTAMIVRLHNLSVRPPVLADLEAVTALMAACDAVEAGLIDPTEDELRSSWQSAGISLKTDAWVITNKERCIVGYADVRRGEGGQLTFALRVHPNYRGRGIGTLLIWLVEERARQIARELPMELRVTLSHEVSNLNQAAQQLLTREGYTLARHIWRLLIEMDEISSTLSDESRQDGRITMDLVVDSQSIMSAAPLAKRTGMYVTRQYHVYEKELRAAQEHPSDSQGNLADSVNSQWVPA